MRSSWWWSVITDDHTRQYTYNTIIIIHTRCNRACCMIQLVSMYDASVYDASVYIIYILSPLICAKFGNFSFVVGSHLEAGKIVDSLEQLSFARMFFLEKKHPTWRRGSCTPTFLRWLTSYFYLFKLFSLSNLPFQLLIWFFFTALSVGYFKL